MNTLFSEIEPFNYFFLKTDNLHSIYVEQCGNPNGVPVVFLHGGPCSGCKPDHRRFFDPSFYHIILLDQRGCGRSLPFGECENNTLFDLIADLERIREFLYIEKWLLFGGSWGATLALAYAQKHTERVLGLILRGSFLARLQDMLWFLGKYGASLIYPEMWQHVIESVPHGERTDDLLADLCRVLWGKDELAIRRVVKAWQVWGGQVALGNLFELRDEHITEHDIKQTKMELHYAKHSYFLAKNELLEHCEKLQHLPVTIIHGRNDLVCPIEAGYKLHHALPQSKFVVLPNSGHIAQGDEMIDALVSATIDFQAKNLSDF